MSDFDVAFERDVLAMAAGNPQYRRRARRVLREHAFSDPVFDWFWNDVIGPLGDGDRATGAVVKAALGTVKGDERTTRIEVALDLLRRTPDAPGIALDRLIEYRASVVLNDAMQRAIKALRRDDVEGCREALTKGLRRSSSDDYSYQDWMGGFEERQAIRRHRMATGLSTKVATRFMPTFDSISGGGIEAPELGIIVGTTGRGKSQFAANLAYWAAAQGINVGYATTEMSVEMQATRLDARHLDIPYGRVKDHQFDEAELAIIADKIGKTRDRFMGRLRIAHLTIRRATIDMLETLCDDMEADGFPVGLLVIDSGDHIIPGTRFGTRRDKETLAYMELAGLAADRELPVWSTAHAPKSVVNKLITAEDVGETYDKSRLAAVVLTLNQTRGQEEMGYMRVHVAKMRQAAGRQIIHVLADKSRSHFREITEQEVSELGGREDGD